MLLYLPLWIVLTVIRIKDSQKEQRMEERTEHPVCPAIRLLESDTCPSRSSTKLDVRVSWRSLMLSNERLPVENDIHTRNHLK